MTTAPPGFARDKAAFTASLKQRPPRSNKHGGLSEVAIDGIASAIVSIVRQQLAPIKQRLVALEARPELKYAGVWRDDRGYLAGCLVTDAGSCGWPKPQRTPDPAPPSVGG